MKSHSCFASTTRLVAAREEPDTDFVTCGSGVKQTTPTINPKYTRWFIIQLQIESAALVHYTVCQLQRGPPIIIQNAGYKGGMPPKFIILYAGYKEGMLPEFIIQYAGCKESKPP